MIALDIDGTITADKYSISNNVVDYLEGLHRKGWQITILSGRSLLFSKSILKSFSFPIFFGMFNGACTVSMPEKKVLFKSYMDKTIVGCIEKARIGLETALLIYSGFENNDTCYLKLEDFWKKHPGYMKDIEQRHKNSLKVVETSETSFINNLKPFPLIKCIGTLEKMTVLAERLRNIKKCTVSIVKDPFDERFYFLLITGKNVDKGHAVKKIWKELNLEGIIVAAGNDDNDVCLLEVANIKIAMSGSPQYLLDKADIIAPPAEEDGIISALDQVMSKIDNNGV
jgi:Cof subfamily protein (haloacid dehalogenase superfamily)